MNSHRRQKDAGGGDERECARAPNERGSCRAPRRARRRPDDGHDPEADDVESHGSINCRRRRRVRGRHPAPSAAPTSRSRLPVAHDGWNCSPMACTVLVEEHVAAIDDMSNDFIMTIASVGHTDAQLAELARIQFQRERLRVTRFALSISTAMTAGHTRTRRAGTRCTLRRCPSRRRARAACDNGPDTRAACPDSDGDRLADERHRGDPHRPADGLHELPGFGKEALRSRLATM